MVVMVNDNAANLFDDKTVKGCNRRYHHSELVFVLYLHPGFACRKKKLSN